MYQEGPCKNKRPRESESKISPSRGRLFFAERQGFEPWDPQKRSTVFETAPIDHSGTSPLKTSFLQRKNALCCCGFRFAKVQRIFELARFFFDFGISWCSNEKIKQYATDN